MDILVLLSRDAANLMMEKSIHELYKRGHHLYAYAYNLEWHNICMFSWLESEIKSINDLTNEVINTVDIIFSANDMIWHVINARKYIFTINIASVMGTYISEGGDIMFMPSYEHFWGGKEDNISIVVGNTKNKKMNVCETHIDDNNNILIIDCGHYPFGKAGKMQLANLLIDISNEFPNNHFFIKPRFLLSDKDVTHRSNVHLYDCIAEVSRNNVPQNLELVDNHMSMDEALEKADTVICMLSSAIFDVISAHKNMVIVSGIDNKDSVDLNDKYIWKIEEELFDNTNCLVDISEIKNYLPFGLHCSREFELKHVPVFGNKLAYEHVADIVEYCYSSFIVNNHFIKQINTDANSYAKDICIDENITWTQLINKRYRNELVYLFTRYFIESGLSINFDVYREWIDNTVNDIISGSKYDFHRMHASVIRKQHEIMLESERLIKGNGILESYWLEALYDIDRLCITKYDRTDFICERSYLYFCGLVNYENKNYFDAYKMLKSYLLETSNIEYEEYVTDRDCFVQNAMAVLNNIFPFFEVNPELSVALYGAGVYGREFYLQTIESGFCNIDAIIDKSVCALDEIDVPIIKPNEINQYEIKQIVITPRSEKIKDEIEEFLHELHYDGKIIRG